MIDSRIIIQHLLDKYAEEDCLAAFVPFETPIAPFADGFELQRLYKQPSFISEFDGYYLHGPMHDPFFCWQVEKLLDRQYDLIEKRAEAGISVAEFLEFNSLTNDIHLLFD